MVPAACWYYHVQRLGSGTGGTNRSRHPVAEGIIRDVVEVGEGRVGHELDTLRDPLGAHQVKVCGTRALVGRGAVCHGGGLGAHCPVGSGDV